jgi:hypothetical protein
VNGTCILNLESNNQLEAGCGLKLLPSHLKFLEILWVELTLANLAANSI